MERIDNEEDLSLPDIDTIGTFLQHEISPELLLAAVDPSVVPIVCMDTRKQTREQIDVWLNAYKNEVDRLEEDADPFELCVPHLMVATNINSSDPLFQSCPQYPHIDFLAVDDNEPVSNIAQVYRKMLASFQQNRRHDSAALSPMPDPDAVELSPELQADWMRLFGDE